MSGAAYFLLGDSAPRDAFIAEALRERIGHHFSSWTDQHDINFPPHERYFRNFKRRSKAFVDYMAGQPRHRPIILMGRSSGGRVASFCASRCNATAVVCLAYPFRRPDNDEDPDRYQHLATTSTPTLVLQGRSDLYGGADDLSAYKLSASVSVRSVETDHNMRLQPREWDDVAKTIVSFWHDVLAHRAPVAAF